MHVCAPQVYRVPIEAKRGIQGPWNWSYRGLQAAMWVQKQENLTAESGPITSAFPTTTLTSHKTAGLIPQFTSPLPPLRVPFPFLISSLGDREMAQWFTALVAIAEDRGSSPITHRTVQDPL